MAIPIKPNIGTKADFAPRPSVPAHQKELASEFNLVVESIRANYERLILNWDTDVPVNTNLPVGQYVLFDNAIYKITTAYNVGNPISWVGGNAEIIIQSSPEHYKGTHATSGALIAAHPTAVPGDYALVDPGGATPAQWWLWDNDDAVWLNSSPTTPGLPAVLAVNNSAAGYQIKLMGNATEAQDAITLSQMNAAIAAAVTGLLDYRGGFNASPGIWPTAANGGSGVGGAILKADVWVVTVAGTLTGMTDPVDVGDWLVAKVDGAGNTAADWSVVNKNVVLATDTVAGILKLYQATGTNIDGAISQLIVTNALNLKSNRKWTIVPKTGSYTMAAAELTQIESGVALVMEGNNTGDLTIPPNATVAFGIGDTWAIRGFNNVVQGAGVVVAGTNGSLSVALNRTVLIEKTGLNTWLLHNGTTPSTAWTDTGYGTVERSLQAEMEAIASGASTATTGGLSTERTGSEFGLYYMLRKMLTLAWTWSIGPIISDATINTPAIFDGTKKLISGAYAALADWITGTDNTKVVTVASFVSYRSLKQTPLTLLSTTLTIDVAGAVEKCFTVAASFTAAFNILWSGHTDAQYIELWIPVNGTVAVTLTNGTSSQPNIVSEDSDLRYVNTTKVLTLVTTSAKYFRLSFTRQTVGATGVMSMEVSLPISLT